MDEQAARGSDDEYCSTYPSDGHAYSSHSVDAAPIRWIMRCQLCGHISSAAIRQQLTAPPAQVEAVAKVRHEVDMNIAIDPAVIGSYARRMRTNPPHAV